MDTIFNVLSQGWIGTLLGLVGIALAVVFYLKSRRKAKLAFQYDYVTLVGAQGAAFPDEVKVYFAGTVVPRITASRIVVWNCGDRTINRDDLVEGDPLRVELPESGQILKHTILRQTRGVNAWGFDQVSPNRVNVNFEFLDPGDGLSLEVIHSQAGDELDVVGTIRGIPAGLLNYGHAYWAGRAQRKFPRNLLVIASAVGVLLVLNGLLEPLLVQSFPGLFDPIDRENTRRLFVVLGVVYAVFPGFLLWRRRRRYPAKLEPES